jgi:DGQHR domain-containing protein
MTVIPPPSPTVPASAEFDFISGRYADSDRPVAYFVSVMTYRDAANSLKLVSEIPGASGVEWTIEELFQREVNWRRVQQRILPYIQRTKTEQFFNAITIALLPQRDGRVASADADGWHAPEMQSAQQFQQGGCVKKFGPITCGYWGKWERPSDSGARLGKICWNINETVAVAIDGQHRLAAIKDYVRSNPGMNSSIPVILIVSHPELGSAGQSAETSPVALTRKLFIDLNKHSVKVSRAREILLDDFDIGSLCTRSLVEERLSSGLSALDRCRLPLVLVDWHSEQAKIEKGPYVATILGLDWMVAKCLDLGAPFDPMDFEEIEKLIGKLQKLLRIDLGTALTRLTHCREFETPFEFAFAETGGEPSELQRIEQYFIRAWGPAIIHLITEFAPYKQLVKVRKTDGSDNPLFSAWWAAKCKADTDQPGPNAQQLADIENQLRAAKDAKATPDKFAKNIEKYNSLKAESELAYTVVFQRALISAFLRFLKAPLSLPADMAGNGGTGSVSEPGQEQDAASSLGFERLRKAKLFSDAIGRVSANRHDFLNKNCVLGQRRNLWSGSLLKDEDASIDFTGRAHGQAADVLLSCALMHYIREVENEKGSFKALWGERVEGAEKGDGAYLRLSHAFDRMAAEDGIGGRIAKARNEQNHEQVAAEEVKARMKYLWEALSKD